ncbi:MAG: GFA family protein [Proteobacteria bacterium]|nr:GFA family protein [Pseudomonadota bacterium]MDA1355296.1 GFA family protein [Pseudomonadota bacterium]
MSDENLAGGCLCGAVRYEIEGPGEGVSHCHCEMCRKASGAAFVTWLGVAHDKFRYTQGIPASHRSSETASRSFCAACGSQLQFEYHGTHDHTHVSVGSLDQPGRVTPARHIWVHSRIPWANYADGLPEFSRET